MNTTTPTDEEIRARLEKDGAYYLSADILDNLRRGCADPSEQAAAYRVMQSRGEWIVHAEGELMAVAAERDKARRRVCENAIQHGRVYRRVGQDTVRCETPQQVAEMMGWDCYRENTNG